MCVNVRIQHIPRRHTNPAHPLPLPLPSLTLTLTLTPPGLSAIDEAILNMEEVEFLRLRRTDLEQWANELFFDDLVKGLFVRIGVRNDVDRYRIAAVVGQLCVCVSVCQCLSECVYV